MRVRRGHDAGSCGGGAGPTTTGTGGRGELGAPHAAHDPRDDKGLVEEDKLNSFNLPIYGASVDEVKAAVEQTGLFDINEIRLFESNRDPYDDSENDSVQDSIRSGVNVAKCIRAVMETLFVSHFGKSILDALFKEYASKGLIWKLEASSSSSPAHCYSRRPSPIRGSTQAPPPSFALESRPALLLRLPLFQIASRRPCSSAFPRPKPMRGSGGQRLVALREGRGAGPPGLELTYAARMAHGVARAARGWRSTTTRLTAKFGRPDAMAHGSRCCEGLRRGEGRRRRGPVSEATQSWWPTVGQPRRPSSPPLEL